MTDFSGLTGFKKLVMNFRQQVLESNKSFLPDGENCVDKETFCKDNPLADKSIFDVLDLNKDGYVSEHEYMRVSSIDTDGDGTISTKEAQEYRERCMEEALRLARRNIDKWFAVDIDRDGHWSNVEGKMSGYRFDEQYTDIEHIKDPALTNDELAQKYNMKEELTDFKLEKYIEGWLGYIKTNIAQNSYGIELTPNEMAILRSECLKQLNTWLMKTGDNATSDAPLYNSLNPTSYTRLLTTKETESCCGGSITPPPMSPEKDSCMPVFSSLEFSPEDYEKAAKQGTEPDPKTLVNNAEEFKNRLAWAIFNALPKEKLDTNPDHTVWQSLSDEEYAMYHQQWNNIRSKTAQEFRDMLKPENTDKKREFESNSLMTVNQIVQYIDIVESYIGKPWDDNDWQINAVDFHAINDFVNDVADDKNRLDGKTRKDVPENRQKLLKFLEERDWLYEQFKN